ncbi:orotidine 5'-phosphate decarboxylase [cyanobacterium endosymbiont of Rhopalodia gibberula]|uniref:orotidine-5'-phosphate decarboxylase n=1 Tax=cyanobacterium endosymbiont of Rhopalodia gibberula TaxID=1763363 RepID=UPI000DC7112E|nr:orotidine-5'-phosphate decarboxylase [cyanobacterium endosymbiont of Rhopalodia gibberula]BBA79996.1 orotidine 5'-phosphate decarboxylase [cyanobacterium endosymbiont of Rhopalodia gibberula]
MSPANQVIVPLDVPNLTEAITLLDKLPQVSFWKVGLELFAATGPNILTILKERKKRIFLDLKFHDIPNTVAGACRSASEYGVDFLTIHATAGQTALQAATKAINNTAYRPQLLAITLLTSLNSRELAFDLKVSLNLPEYILKMAIFAQKFGANGAVCSPREVSQLRQICGDDFLLVCPGIRPSWFDNGDQRRVMTPSEAMKAGADYLVIGRPITMANDPIAAWEKICEELEMV